MQRTRRFMMLFDEREYTMANDLAERYGVTLAALVRMLVKRDADRHARSDAKVAATIPARPTPTTYRR